MPTVGARPSSRGRRRRRAAMRRVPAELPPLLQQILAEYSATGLPPAYLPKQEHGSSPQAEQGGAA